MAQDNDAMDATITEHLPEMQNEDHDEPAAVTYGKNSLNSWEVVGYEVLDDDPYEYTAKCSCGEEFPTWVSATAHVDEEH